MSTCPPCGEKQRLAHQPQHPSRELSQRGDRGTHETPPLVFIPHHRAPGSSPDDGGDALDVGHAGGERRGHRRLRLRQRDADVGRFQSPAVVGAVPAHPHAVAAARRDPIFHNGTGEKPWVFKVAPLYLGSPHIWERTGCDFAAANRSGAREKSRGRELNPFPPSVLHPSGLEGLTSALAGCTPAESSGQATSGRTQWLG